MAALLIITRVIVTLFLVQETLSQQCSFQVGQAVNTTSGKPNYLP